MRRTAVDESERVRAGSEIAAFRRALYARDWMPGTAGNLSVRLPGGAVLITAGGRDKGDMTAEDMVVVRADTGEETVSLSDVAEELDAAAAAGWRTVGVRRPGDPRGPEVAGHPSVSALDDTRLHRGTRRGEGARA
ncbi:class II aldolase/adducin family protein [Streptomyces sp. Act-28]